MRAGGGVILPLPKHCGPNPNHPLSSKTVLGRCSFVMLMLLLTSKPKVWCCINSSRVHARWGSNLREVAQETSKVGQWGAGTIIA